MGDQNKYINTYVDVTVGTVHELLNQVLQLKTEARITSDLVSEKDQVISTLQNEKDQVINKLQAEKNQIASALENEQERSRIEHEEADKANQQVRQWEDEVNSLRTKAGNFDACAMAACAW